MGGNEIDMRLFASSAGANISFPAGSVVFNKGDPGSCMYVVQSGVIEMMIGDTVIEVCSANEAIGFMSMIDNAPRSSTARVKEDCQLSLIDQRKFRSWWMRCRTSRSTSWARWRVASAAWDRQCVERPVALTKPAFTYYEWEARRDGVEAFRQRKANPMWPDRRVIELFKIRHPDRPGADGGRHRFRNGGGGGASRRPRLGALRDAHARQGARADRQFRERTEARSTSTSSVTRRRNSTMHAKRAGANG